MKNSKKLNEASVMIIFFPFVCVALGFSFENYLFFLFPIGLFLFLPTGLGVLMLQLVNKLRWQSCDTMLIVIGILNPGRGSTPIGVEFCLCPKPQVSLR